MSGFVDPNFVTNTEHYEFGIQSGNFVSEYSESATFRSCNFCSSVNLAFKSIVSFLKFHLNLGDPEITLKDADFHALKTVSIPTMENVNSKVFMEIRISKMSQIGF